MGRDKHNILIVSHVVVEPGINHPPSPIPLSFGEGFKQVDTYIRSKLGISFDTICNKPLVKYVDVYFGLKWEPSQC